MVTSGIRLGTPALTTRGMKEDEMRLIGRLIAAILKDIRNEDKIKEVKEAVDALCLKFPLYSDRL
jgi:glycine hydroxymethyltransferase